MDLALVNGVNEVLQAASKCTMVRDEDQRPGKGVLFVGRSGKND